MVQKVIGNYTITFYLRKVPFALLKCLVIVNILGYRNPTTTRQSFLSTKLEIMLQCQRVRS